MEYKRLGQVSAEIDGIPVELCHQERIPDDGPSFDALSWRTRYRSGGTNRQWYWLKDGGCWTIPRLEATRLLAKASRKGMLNERYDDPFTRFGGGAPRFIVSTGYDRASRSALLREITRPVGEPDWGADPRFIVAEEPNGEWRKVLLVDTAGKVATFRSLTTDLGGQSRWRFDNTMMDCSIQVMREFQRWLIAFK